jgi:hypothetical protein
VEPTAAPTPTAEPTVEPTAAPTPTAEPTAEPTAAPTPLPEGALPVVDGKVQAEANWIIANTGTQDQPVYRKLGEVQDVDGYTMEAEANGGDSNAPNFYYKPAADSPVDDVRVMAANYDAKSSAERAAKGYAAYFKNGVSSEATEATIAGRTGWFFSCDFENAVATTATPAPDATPAASQMVRMVSVYFDAPNGLSVVISVTTKPGDAAALPDVDSMTKLLEPFVQMLAVEDDIAAATVAPEATVAPAEATIAPAEATAVPAEATVAPAQATVAPAEATVAPAEATAAPSPAA